MPRYVNIRADHGVLVAALPPEINSDNVEDLGGELAVALAGRPSRLVLDMSETRFCSSAGLQLLLTLDRRARRGRIHLAVVMSHRLRRLLQGVADDDLPVLFSTLADALADRRTRSAAHGEPDDARLPDPAATPVRIRLDAGTVPVTGVYVDEETRAPCWVAVGPGPTKQDGERLLPVAAIATGGADGRLRSKLRASVVLSSPALHGAPERLCDCDEDPIWRHYAHAASPAPPFWPRPSTCSARRSVRVDDVGTVLADLLARQPCLLAMDQSGDRAARA